MNLPIPFPTIRAMLQTWKYTVEDAWENPFEAALVSRGLESSNWELGLWSAEQPPTGIISSPSPLGRNVWEVVLSF